jgi:predicted metal-dependent hydrolase
MAVQAATSDAGSEAQSEQRANAPWSPPIRIVASRRRRRTVSASLRSGILEVHVPHGMSNSEQLRWAEVMRARIERQLERARPTDAKLEARAHAINRRYFGGRLQWNSIAWADQGRRWGSCSYMVGVIRISERAVRLPEFILDYLLVHELAHLEHADHGPAFWELVHRFPFTERARGYLMAIDHGIATMPGEEPGDDEPGFGDDPAVEIA